MVREAADIHCSVIWLEGVDCNVLRMMSALEKLIYLGWFDLFLIAVLYQLLRTSNDEVLWVVTVAVAVLRYFVSVCVFRHYFYLFGNGYKFQMVFILSAASYLLVSDAGDRFARGFCCY